MPDFRIRPAFGRFFNRRWLPLLMMLAPASPVAAQSVPASGPSLIEAEARAAFERWRSDAHAPGLAWGVVRTDGTALHVAGVQDVEINRPVTTATRFRIASMTKAFTALAILVLRDAGRLSLDDPAEKYVPEMRGWRYLTSDSPRIRVRDLLGHSAGLVTDDPWGDRQQVLSQAEFTRLITQGVPFSRVPQSSHEYSNYGYALLGRIVANVSGMSYRAYIERTILRPLGMRDTGFEVGDVRDDVLARGYRWENGAWVPEPAMRDGAFNAMGGLITTASDYAKWVRFLLSGWPARDGADQGIVRRATIREIVQGSNFVQYRQRPGGADPNACRQAGAYGMGWRVAMDCDLGLTLSHGGGYPGYGSHVLLLPEAGVGIFALSNRTYAGPSGPVWDAAIALRKAGELRPAAVALNPLLAEMEAAARDAYAAGSLAPLDGRLAMNFLMDRSAANWASEFARLKAIVGDCPTADPLTPTGNLTALFRWHCTKGKLSGQILLAPTNPPTIQSLAFVPQPD